MYTGKWRIDFIDNRKAILIDIDGISKNEGNANNFEPFTNELFFSDLPKQGIDIQPLNGSEIATMLDVLPQVTRQIVDARNLSASSSLADSKIADRYSPDKAFDGDPLTSWVEGVEGNGQGQILEIAFEKKIMIDAIEVMPGYFDQKYWQRNNRIRELKVSFDSQSEPISLTFTDDMVSQRISIELAVVKSAEFEIAGTFKGTSWDDTCIAEIAFYLKGERVTLNAGLGINDRE